MKQFMPLDAKIYVAGHRGLAGSAILRQLEQQGYKNLLFRTSQELDLTRQDHVETFFAEEKPDYVFLCAAKVGGILANNQFPANFIQQNLLIQTLVIHEAMKNHVQRLLFLGSSCIYPRECPQPIREDYFLSGKLEQTNRAYAVAKIAGVEMCWAYNRQYKTNFLCAMPTNMYGPNDNYDLENSHVLPALLRKFHEAKVENRPQVELWGTGNVKREFLHSDDMARASLFLMNLPEEIFGKMLKSDSEPPIINVGTGEDLTIRELAEIVKDVAGYSGEIVWDSSKPDGTPRKVLDISNLAQLGWKPEIGLRDGVSRTYTDAFVSESLSK